jgi:hypothetical protein|tara:strand:- start:37 stop:267 length:231 start_codon:yes stop_codon:yes gene_type:complete
MMDMHDRIMRVLDTTHVVRIEDSTVYKVLDIVPLGDDVLFVETVSGLLFQDLDVFTLEEAANMERQFSEVRKIIAK